jgi:ADP-dependent NAD(P)H-hydrate dehydratase / NAD(P)H-hydrate epimerase
MKFFRTDQIKEIDEYAIKHEPIASIDLMERAAGELYNWISERFDQSKRIIVFAGPGNNGGDGLALARMLIINHYDVEVHYLEFSKNVTPDWVINRGRLEEVNKKALKYLKSSDQFPVIFSGDIIIDAIFGSGLTRRVDGLAEEIIKLINKSDATVISVDIPSGLAGENNDSNSYEGVIKADYTLSFQFPKLSFMFAENGPYTGKVVILPIGLKYDESYINSPYTLLEDSDIFPLLRKRSKFDHKGTFGHGLLVGGSFGKMGASVLGAKAALRTGIGLITCHLPSCGTEIVQSAIPEAMVQADKSENFINEVVSTDMYSAIGIGPGMGKQQETHKVLNQLLKEYKKPMVIDADALNILSLNKEWLNLLSVSTILTPHLKEFERLAGESASGYSRLIKQIEFSKKFNCLIVLKGANSSIITPGGKIFFNSTGNPGMAKGGSGDVLTGIILSLLAQGYSPEAAAVTGVYLHGLAADIAVEESCYESIIASDIINNIGKAFNRIRKLNFEL